ncbi:MAG: deoxyribose-phosphate aldolase [Shewanellaceae bacterium]|nr:deoxyribose-phosphate aldolase [Shewanellaceae bacterium]
MLKHKQVVQLMSWLDLTSLRDEDTAESIANWSQQAQQPWGTAAAVCVYPAWIQAARVGLVHLDAQVSIATVVNFPAGDATPAATAASTTAAIRAGADEIDVVLPYQALLAGNQSHALSVLQACRAACPERVMKVIIESGMLPNASAIEVACQLAIKAGADFIKTSTGKAAVHATLPAVQTILNTIQASPESVGIKISGGVKTLAQAAPYVNLIEHTMGEAWMTPAHVRFGASSLLQDLRLFFEKSAINQM